MLLFGEQQTDFFFNSNSLHSDNGDYFLKTRYCLNDNQRFTLIAMGSPR